MILVDAGPLIALLDLDDSHHAECARYFMELREPLGTVWPVVTEAAHMVQPVHGGRPNLLQLLERRVVKLLPLDEADLPRIGELMEKYHDLPMDLADAALVRVAEREGLGSIFTIDRRDFGVYRKKGGGRFRLVP